MPRTLVVVVPGLNWRGQTASCWNPLIDLLKGEPELAGASWLFHEHGAGPFSSRSASDYAQALCGEIHARWVAEGRFDRIIMIGHSLGGVLLRKAYLMASGADPFSGARLAKPWAASVDRMVLFAGVNRGVNLDTLSFGALYRILLGNRSWRLARDLIRGSDFMTELRIAWIRHFRQIGDREPTVIQLLGARDSVVVNEDSTDVEQFPRAAQEIVEGATHSDVYIVSGKFDQPRYQFLRQQILFASGTAGSPNTESTVKDVVFLIHGIRSSNSEWPNIARDLIRKHYPNALPVPAGYPYFSALNFALPFLRRKQIRWFQDQYAYCFARNINAHFHYIGHSNGTYLLGHALKHIPSIQFGRVTLVGSVLPQLFDWTVHLGDDVPGRRQVDEYRNHRAFRDIPVGLLCSALNSIGMKDVGTGGFTGFLKTDPARSREYFYYPGGHSTVLSTEERLHRLIRYTLEGADDYEQIPRDPDRILINLSRLLGLGPVTAILLIALLAWPALLMFWLTGPVMAAGAEVAYLVVVAIVLKVL